MSNGSAPHEVSVLPGLGLTVLIAAVSHLLSFGHTTLDPLVISMLISIMLGNLIGPRQIFQPGILSARKIFIPLGIMLYGTQLDLRPLGGYGAGRIFHILFMVFFGMYAIYRLSLALGVRRKMSMLISAGSAICGAAAIMVLSPLIDADKEDTSISLLSITVVGLTGVILYPLFQEILSLSENAYALLCGTTLYQVGQVKAASSLMGMNAMNMALPVKLLRVAMLLPIAAAAPWITEKRSRRVYIPWFIVVFIFLAVLSNLSPELSARRAVIAPYAGFFLSVAIAGIGLSVDLESIIDIGPRPLLAAFLGWSVLIALFILGMLFIR